MEAGRRALATLDETGEPGPGPGGAQYNIYDRDVNCDIPRKLRHRYGANVIPLDFLVTGQGEHRRAQNMYWSSGRKILEAARLVAARVPTCT
jgi:predicted nucleotide-binding protein (sugar kinase/HSP70/actin superfamily)